MPTLNYDQIATFAAGAGWPAAELPTAVAVAMAESSGRTEVVGGLNNCCTGLWQIHRVHGQSVAQLQNPSWNARTAVAVWKAQGWKAWEVYTNGNYRQHLPAATAAVQRLAASGAPLISLTGFPGLDDIPDVPGPVDDILRGEVDPPDPGEIVDDITGAAGDAVAGALDLDGLGRIGLTVGGTLVFVLVGGAVLAIGLARLTGTDSDSFRGLADVPGVRGVVDKAKSTAGL